MPTSTIYGPGGHDPSKPNSNIIEQTDLPEREPSEEQLARQSAVAKLQALGLTEAEALALIRI